MIIKVNQFEWDGVEDRAEQRGDDGTRAQLLKKASEEPQSVDRRVGRGCEL